jgi:hypothetical protein
MTAASAAHDAAQRASWTACHGDAGTVLFGLPRRPAKPEVAGGQGPMAATAFAYLAIDVDAGRTTRLTATACAIRPARTTRDAGSHPHVILRSPRGPTP